MIYFIIIISFLLEGLWSMAVSMHHSIWIPLFTLVALITVYPCFPKYSYFFFALCAGVGICYDIVYTNTILLHGALFFVIGHLIAFLYRIFKNISWKYGIILILSLIAYRVLSFLLLVVTGYLSWSFSKLGESIFLSLLANLVYGYLLYGFLVWLKKRKLVHFYN